MSVAGCTVKLVRAMTEFGKHLENMFRYSVLLTYKRHVVHSHIMINVRSTKGFYSLM